MGATRNNMLTRARIALIREYDVSSARKLLEVCLRKSGVSIEDLTILVHKFLTGQIVLPGLRDLVIPSLTLQECQKAVSSVIGRREVAHHLLAGLTMDKYVERLRPLRDLRVMAWYYTRGRFPKIAARIKPANVYNELVHTDYSLFGVDETLVRLVLDLYGRLAYAVFGYLDASKDGVIKKIDKAPGLVNVHLDDLASAIVASAFSKLWMKYEIDQQREDVYPKSLSLLQKWIERSAPDLDQNLSFIIDLAQDRQNKYYDGKVPKSLPEEGLRKVLSKLEVYETLEVARKIAKQKFSSRELLSLAINISSPIGHLYGTIGNTNPGWYAIQQPYPYSIISDVLLLHILSAIQAAVNSYTAFQMEEMMTE